MKVDPSYVREFHILYAGDWIDGASVRLLLQRHPTDHYCAGENGAQFEFEFEDASKQVVERTSQSSLSSMSTFLLSLTDLPNSFCEELVEPTLAQFRPCKNVSF